MVAKFFKVKCLTNMHMGSGDINFNIVDNEVEKDPTTGFAAMYSSVIKGSLRDFFETNSADANTVKSIFGGNDKTSGKVKFLTGNILFQAVRAAGGTQVYYLVTCKAMLDNFFKLRKAIGIDDVIGDIKDQVYCSEECRIESRSYAAQDSDSISDKLKEFFENVVGKENVSKIVIVPDKDMKDISLPVLARNKLDENGISEQLWYEEVVPHESIFCFTVLSEDEKLLQELSNAINGNMIQFGADASIGYGLTVVNEIGV